MSYVLLFILGLIFGVFVIPFVIYFRARRTGWDDSNIFNIFRVICHLALHPEDFLKMRYEDGKNPFWYLTKDEFSEVVDSRPNKTYKDIYIYDEKRVNLDSFDLIIQEFSDMLEDKPKPYWDGWYEALDWVRLNGSPFDDVEVIDEEE